MIAEVGVAAGEFSAFLLDELRPRRFVAIDTFETVSEPLEDAPLEWLRMFRVTEAGLFGGMSHLDFYRERFAARGEQVVIAPGLSHERLSEFPDKSFDLIYVDAAHDYESVRRDAEVAKRKIKPDGILAFNDYIFFDHTQGVPYGVIQAVNELVVGEDWHVVGFALNRVMFCDIAIQRR